jgi:hypothetical protein
MAWATDSISDSELRKTRKFLNETVVSKDQLITIFDVPDRSIFIWSSLTLDDAALEKVEAYPKLQEVRLEDDIEDDSAIPRGESEVEPVWYTVNKQTERAPSDWIKQDDAPRILCSSM